jgi:hypothetical protein
MKPKKAKPVQNVICISDTHIGCRLGLLQPENVTTDEGLEIKPTPLQRVVWSWWEEFWNEWVPLVTRGEPFDLVHNGDAIDGVHHSSTTQITHSTQDQIKLAVNILKPAVEKCWKSGGKYYHIRGTEAHVGKSAQDEEALAQQLGAVPNEIGQHARYELWKRVGYGLVHFLHHIGTTSSSAHESSAVNAELAAEFTEAARWGEEPPSVVVRSHRHRNIEVRIPTKKGFATATVTPAWQLKTPFTWKIPGARLAPPQIGGILIRCGDRAIYTDPFVKHIERAKVE